MIRMNKHILAAFIAAFFLLKTTKGEQVYNLSKGLLNSNVNQVIQVDNDLWLATSRGVSQIINWQNPNTGRKQIVNRATSVAVNAICKYEGDFLWVATNGKGVYKYNTKTREMLGFQHDLFRRKNIVSLAYSADELYLEEQGAGWTKINTKTFVTTKADKKATELTPKTFSFSGVKYGTEDGLLNDNIISEIDHGAFIYLISSLGVDAFHKTYKRAYPVLSKKWSVNQIVRLKSGVLIATKTGLHTYSWEDLEKSANEPKVSLQEWRLDGAVQTDSEMDLSFSNYQFDFILNTKAFTSANKYYYQIDDTNWEEIVTPSFSINGLSHGDYAVKFKACNKGGFCAEVELLNIHIDHPLKKDWIKYAAALLALVIYTIGVIQMNKKKFVRQIQTLEKAVYEKQKELNRLK
jgi:hypothetical protein